MTSVQTWGNMVHSLDAWLWRRGVDHPAIRPLLRNMLLLTGLSFVLGIVLWPLTAWFFWFAVGFGIMAFIFWSLARFFLRSVLGEYSSAFLRVVLFRWGGRLLLVAAVVYGALIVCKAPPSALLAGLSVGSFTGLLSYVLAGRR